MLQYLNVILLLIKFLSLRFILYFGYVWEFRRWFSFWLACKTFSKRKYCGYICYSRNCLFPNLLFLQKSKNFLKTLCVFGQFLPKVPWSLHELLGWFFAPSTRLVPPLFKIARLIVWWHYKAASICIEIDIIFIFLQKIFNSLTSIAENLIIALTIGKTMCICEIYFSQTGFYLAHFHEEIQWKSQKFSGALPQTLPGLCPGHAGRLPNPQLIIPITARLFSQNSKKTDLLIFPYFDHCNQF